MAKSTVIDLYESAIAGAFLYRFGYLDAQNSSVGANLLLNAQNPLDNLLGDLIGELRSDTPKASRYFLVEFKRDLTGDARCSFAGELNKKHRFAFLSKLFSNQLSINSRLAQIARLDQTLSVGGRLRGAGALTAPDLLRYLVRLLKRQLRKGPRSAFREELSKKLNRLKRRLSAGPTGRGQKIVREDRAKFGPGWLRKVYDLADTVEPAETLLAAGAGPFDWLSVLGRHHSLCWRLSLLGHFGVWRSKRMLRAAPYIHAVLGWPGDGWRWGIFRQLWWELRNVPGPVHANGLWFCDGLGLTAEGMLRYLECLFAHCGTTAASDANEIVFGKVTPGGSALAIGRFSSLTAAYEAIHGLRNNRLL